MRACGRGGRRRRRARACVCEGMGEERASARARRVAVSATVEGRAVGGGAGGGIITCRALISASSACRSSCSVEPRTWGGRGYKAAHATGQRAIRNYPLRRAADLALAVAAVRVAQFGQLVVQRLEAALVLRQRRARLLGCDRARHLRTRTERRGGWWVHHCEDAEGRGCTTQKADRVVEGVEHPERPGCAVRGHDHLELRGLRRLLRLGLRLALLLLGREELRLQRRHLRHQGILRRVRLPPSARRGLVRSHSRVVAGAPSALLAAIAFLGPNVVESARRAPRSRRDPDAAAAAARRGVGHLLHRLLIRLVLLVAQALNSRRRVVR